MDIRLRNLQAHDRHRWITSAVSPRPIALVTTANSAGLVNAAPFSSFNYLGEDPALVYLGIERYGAESSRNGQLKDTLQNILATSEFVVNMVDEPLLAQAVACATEYPAAVSEPIALGLETEASSAVAVPRLSKAPVALECRRFEVLEFSARRSIVIGEILCIHIRDSLYDSESNRIDLDEYRPMARLGGQTYCRTTDRISMPWRKFEEGSAGPDGQGN